MHIAIIIQKAVPHKPYYQHYSIVHSSITTDNKN